SDALFIENASKSEILNALRGRIQKETAFSLCLPLFDRSLSSSVRIDVALRLDQIFSTNPSICEFVRARFYHSTTPDVALDSLISLLQDLRLSELNGFLSTLREDQPFIRQMALFWTEVSEGEFSSDDDRDDVWRTLVDTCVFLDCADFRR